MQISHQHKLIICSQYGNHCRNDSFGDIPGQVVSAFDLLIFWTIKSALVLVSGMSLLIVEKFPSAGLHMVREANGQNKSRFTPSMLGTIFLVMTVSHYYSACENILLCFQRPYFWMEEHFSTVARSISITVSVFLSAVLFDDYIYTLNSFRSGSGQIIVQPSQQHLATILQHFLVFLLFPTFQLLIYFHKPVIFPDVVDFPSVFKFSAFNYHFPAQPTPEQIQHSFLIVRKNIFLFLQISHYQQVHEPANK